MDTFNLQYYLVFAFLTFFSLLISLKLDLKEKASRLPNFYIIPILLSIMLLFGNRGREIGADTRTYIYMFQNIEMQDFGFEFLNSILFNFIGAITYDYEVLLIIYSILFVTVYSLALKNFSAIFGASFPLVLFAGICIFTYKNMGINIMRQGVALSFFLFGLSLLLNRNKWSYLFFFISIGFHTTSLILLFLVFIQKWFRNININIFYSVYIVAIILSFLSIGIKNIASIVDLSVLDEKRTEGYLNTAYNVYETGFKLNFVVFNTIFLLIFNFIRKTFDNKNYEMLLRLYITTSVVFFFMFEIPFSDRWGLFSWVLIPVLISPIYSSNFKYKLKTITTFFLIMIFVVFEYIMWN